MADADFKVKAIISAQTSQFEKGIKNAQSSINSLSSSLNNITNLVKKAFAFTGIAIGTKAIADFGKSCVQSANQAIKQFNILDNTVKATGADAWTSIESLESASKSLSDQTNYSVTEIQKMQSVLLGFTNITGEAFDGASEAVLDMATVMGMDLTSAVQTVGKALDDPITGLDSLRRQGFKFTDEQKAELAQLVRNGKQLEAQKIILDTLSTSYGGAAKAGQDSFAKQRHAIENFSDALGGKLIPLMKSFALDNANMINSLRESLDEIDFNEIGAVIKVTFDGIKKGIQNAFEYIKKIFSETKSLMKNIDFKPLISIINNLVLAFEKIGKINLSRITSIIQDLKDSFSGFSENIDLTKFSEVINLMINGFVFLYEEANKVFDTLLDNIKTFITNTWNSIKSIFEAGNEALANSENDIKSWGDYFYTIFNNLFKTVQDVIQSIAYLLSGDWNIAWEYAKLVVLRIVDSVIDSMTTMMTAFRDKIVGILNFAQMLTPFLGTTGVTIKTALAGIEALVEGVDKNSKKIKDSMTELVENTEAKIEELTGKPADKNIEDLEKFTSGTKSALGKFVDNFKEATDKAKKELDDLSGEYKATTGSIKDDNKSMYEAFSEWDSKLLQQRLENLNEWSTEYHDIQLALIEQERKKALESAKTEEERAKINKYFNGKIEAEDKRFQDAKKERVKEILRFIAQSTINAVKSIVETFKKVINTISKVIQAGFNIFKKLFSINIDDMLNTLLEFEDSILTFFVETLPRLPEFIGSVIQSIKVLFQSLKANIKAETISDVVFNMLKQLSDSLPTLISDLLDILTELLNGAIDGLIKWLDEDGLTTIFTLLLKIQKVAEDFVSNNLEKIVDMLSKHVDDIANFLAESMTSANKTLPKIIKAVTKFIITIIQIIGKIFENKEFVDSMVQAIIDIVKILLDNLPRLIDSLVTAIVSIIKALTPYLPKILSTLISAIFNAIPSVMDSLIKGFGEIFKAIFTAIFNGDFWKDVFGGIGEIFTNLFKKKENGAEGYGSNSTGSTAGDIAVDFLVPFGFLRHFFANGTQNAPAGLSVVGEAGPELVKFRGGEQVINNRNTQKLLANANGSTNNFNVTFNNLQDTSAYAMMNQLKQYNRQMAINGVL